MTNGRRKRYFSDDFKADAVRLVLDEGKTVSGTARELDLTPTALRNWVVRARAQRNDVNTPLTMTEREELIRLRRENRLLREERAILEKAAVLFARQNG